MTAPTVPTRKVRDVDRDIEGFCKDRARALRDIENALNSVAQLRAAYARAGQRIDRLLDERLKLANPPPSTEN